MNLPVLPIVSVSMAESLKKLGFSDVTPFCYNDGDLTEYQENLLLAPSLQEVQAWIGRRKRMDVLVYREVLFLQLNSFLFPLLQNNNVTPTSLIQVKTKPYLHAAFRRSLRFPPLGNQQSDAHSQRLHRIPPWLSAYINASFPIADKGTT